MHCIALHCQCDGPNVGPVRHAVDLFLVNNSVCASVHVCVRACMRACVRACVRVCVRACVCVCMQKILEAWLEDLVPYGAVAMQRI